MISIPLRAASTQAKRTDLRTGAVYGRRTAGWRRSPVRMRAEGKATVGPEPPADVATGESSGEATEPEEAPEQQEQPLEQLLAAIKEGNSDEAAKLAEDMAKGLTAETEESKAAYKQADEQLRQLKDQYRRLQADFDNFRSRADAEKAKTGANAKSHVLEDLLPVIDNFEIAAKSIKTETEGEEKINSAYQNLYRQVVDIFRNLGLEAVPTVGTQFDPEIHDGIMREENDDVADGEVLEEFRKGFKFKDQLLRPAMVKVAVSSAPADAKPGPEDIKTDSD